MQKSTDMWFRYLKEDRTITEGLRDIGLPEYVIDFIEDAMPEAPEKSKMLMGNLWKNDREYDNPLKQLQFDIVNNMINEYNDYVIADGPKDSEGRPGEVRACLISAKPGSGGLASTGKGTSSEEVATCHAPL